MHRPKLHTATRIILRDDITSLVKTLRHINSSTSLRKKMGGGPTKLAYLFQSNTHARALDVCAHRAGASNDAEPVPTYLMN